MLLLLLAPGGGLLAQEGVELTSRRPPFQATTSAYYQRYVHGGLDVAELSFPVSAVLPLNRRMSVSLRTSPATASGRGLQTLAGPSDAQLGLSYYRSGERSSIVFSLGVNLPSGKRALTREELETLKVVSRPFFDFRVPSLGQGLNLAPGFTWAARVRENLVLGLGASYQYRGRFEPLAQMEERFDPGGEVLLTGGADVRLTPVSALSGDVTYTLYAADRVGERQVYEAGNTALATLRFMQARGFNELHLLARYRSRARSDVLAAGGFVTEAERTVPDQGEVRGTYRLRVNRTVHLGLMAGGRLFGESRGYGRQHLVDAGLLPELRLSGALRVAGRFVYSAGSFSGFEAGTGLVLTL